MPRAEQYSVRVTVSVELISTTVGTVAEYAVTRHTEGGSRSGMVGLVETATAAAVAGSKALTAGVNNAEQRRLK